MKPMNIYLCGVGGQGIGLLSGALGAACVSAGYRVRGCDTHGLAQRGGIVLSHLRLGESVFTPLVPAGQADLVIALERLEAYRGVVEMLRPGGTLVYYDATLQPLAVRLGEASYPSREDLEREVHAKQGRLERVFDEGLTDPRMQNIALLGRVGAIRAVDGIDAEALERAIALAVPAKLLEENLEVFRASAMA
ncbi:MAG: 2-oxoacid:acceptor oxidoreductase family protein [bacterium]